MLGEPWKFGIFSFSSWQAHCASNAGERVDMELISHTLGKKHQGMCQERRKLFFTFYLSSITGVRLRDLHESGMSHELFSASWNAYYKVRLCSVHVCSCYLSCFFSSCCWGKGMESCVTKGGFVPKPVGWTCTRERRLTVWSLVTFGQVLAG